MSMGIGHFAVGAMGTALLLAVTVPRLLRSPTVLVCGGVWGMLPDAHWVLPVGADAVYALHGSVWANVFWFHRALDRLDASDSRLFAAGSVGLLLVVVASTEWYARWRTDVRPASGRTRPRRSDS